MPIPKYQPAFTAPTDTFVKEHGWEWGEKSNECPCGGLGSRGKEGIGGGGVVRRQAVGGRIPAAGVSTSPA